MENFREWGRASTTSLRGLLLAALTTCSVGASCSPDGSSVFDHSAGGTGEAGSPSGDTGGSGTKGSANETSSGGSSAGGSNTGGSANETSSGGSSAGGSSTTTDSASGGSSTGGTNASVNTDSTSSASSATGGTGGGTGGASNAGGAAGDTSTSTGVDTGGTTSNDTSSGGSTSTTGDGGQGGTQGTTDGTTLTGSCDDPIELEGMFDTLSGSTPETGSHFNESCGGEGSEVVFSWAAPASGRYRFNAQSSAGSALYLLGAEGCADDFDALDCDAANGAQSVSSIETVLSEGDLVTLVLDTQNAGSAAFELEVEEVELQCVLQDLGQTLGTAVYDAPISHASTRDGSRVAMGCSGGPPWMTFAWSAPAAGTYRFSTLGSDYDTVLFVLPACGSAVSQCSDDTETSITSATDVTLAAGELVIIDVGSWDGALDENDVARLVLNISEVD